MALPAPPANVDNAVRDYLAGESCQVVAARHRISQGRLKRILEERGAWRDKATSRALAMAKARRPQVTLPDSDIVARYLAGESVNQLAHAFGVSRRTIDKRLDAAGVERRGSTEANRAMAAGRTPEENLRLMAAAHRAQRGRRKPLEQKIKAAATRERLQTHVSDHEKQLAEALRARGIQVTPQKAIGPYNVDLASGSIAVEVFGGGWHAYGIHRKRTPERLRYILDEGWNLVIVWASANRWPVGPGACDYIVAFAQEASGDPSMRGEYRVIFGDGQDATRPGLDVDDLARVPSRSGRKSPRPRDDGSR